MPERLKGEIFNRVKQYHDIKYKMNHFSPGEDYMNYSGYVGSHVELQNIVDCALRRWFTLGHYSELFSSKLKMFLDTKHCILTNSGSSANLLAISALTSPKLLARRCNEGDEIITTACCFPTTIAPIVQNGLVPVFVDVNISDFNMNTAQIETAVSNRTKAIFVTHSFGNPANMDKIMEVAKKHNLWVIEDNCDALGAKWDGKMTGTIGDIGTFSFYPAHHITTGEGGAVVTNNEYLAPIIQSFRDWGRDCRCKPGDVAVCKNRFCFKMGDLPKGYDHKYIFSHIGFNLKMTEMSAAIGVGQMKRIREFIRKRNRNFEFLRNVFSKYGYFILPKVHPKATPSWFSFPFTYPKRDKFIQFFEKKKIQTRLIFSGNILKQPAFKYIKHRCVNGLINTNIAMNESMFIGVYPGINIKMLQYIEKTLKEYIKCHA